VAEYLLTSVLDWVASDVIDVVDFIQCLVEFLVLTFNILVKVCEFHGLEIIEIHFGLVLVLEIVVVLGYILLARHYIETAIQGCGIVGVELIVE